MRIAAALLVGAVLGLTGILGGVWGFGYLLLYVAATVPGWPLGAALFGRSHPAGWVAGGVLGYAMTAVALASAIGLGIQSGYALIVVWAVVAILSFGATSFAKGPLLAARPWTRRDATALLLVLLLVPALMARPLSHVGASDSEGNKYYRAYFTADFLWHVALTGELTRFSLPPTNPYAADQSLHYYWTYFVVPGVIAGQIDRGDFGVERSLKLNALYAGLLFIASIFLSVWLVVPDAVAAGLAVALAVLASSAEALYGGWSLLNRGRTFRQMLDQLGDINVDAITNWAWGGLRVDGLQRSLWYVPQHAAACALGLIGLMVAVGGGSRAPLGAALIAGLAFGLSVAFSPLIGAAFALAYGLTILIDVLQRRPIALRSLGLHTLAAVPVAAALLWCAQNRMFEGGSAALYFGMAGPARRAPVQTLLLGLGPLLAAAVAGVFPLRGFPYKAIAAGLGAVIGLWLMYFVILVPDQFWVGFRAGQILLITLPVLAARFFQISFSREGWRRFGVAAAVVLFAVGLPTTLIDEFEAQDITNTAMGPGFHWTVHITPEQQQAFSWLRHATPRDAVVQMEPISRGRETWTLIPTFAERRMAAGLPISLLHEPLYDERSQKVHDLYGTKDGRQAWIAATELGIDYLYLDNVEREAFSKDAIDKFDRNPQYFASAFRNDEVAIFAIARRN